MLLSYTPDQQLLFDQSPEHWTEEEDGWIRHASGARLQIREQGGTPAPDYVLHDAAGLSVAMLASQDQTRFLPRLPELLRRLQDAFSQERRHTLSVFLDRIAFLVMNHGGHGDHRVYLPDMHSGNTDIIVVGARKTPPLPLVFPPEVQNMIPSLPWTLAREMDDDDTLGSSSLSCFYLSMPGSRHAMLNLRHRLVQTYDWARPTR